MTKKYIAPKCGFRVVGNHIETDGSVKNKISGTSLAGILGKSPYTTPFRVACALLGICSEDLDGKFAVEFGKAHESSVINYLNDRFSEMGVFIPAEDVYEKREGDHDAWVSDFEDDVFAGHVDGVFMDRETGEDRILEVKTSGNLESWSEGVPEYYKMQVSLYNHFICKRDRAYVALGMRSQDDTIEGWKATDDTVRLFDLEINDEEFSKDVECARQWYSDFIEKGITPEVNPNDKGDVEMWEYINAITADGDKIRTSVDRLIVLKDMINERKLEMQGLEDEFEKLKSEVKTHMTTHSIKSFGDSSGKWQACITESVRKSVDANLLLKAGIDPEPYYVSKITETFSLKPIKEKKKEE